jgi:hypothetical protein
MKSFVIVLLAVFCLGAFHPAAAAGTSSGELDSLKGFAFFEPGPTFTTTNYFDHNTSEMRTEIVTTPFSGSDLSATTPALFRKQMREAHERFEGDKNRRIISGDDRAGLNIVYNCDASVPAAAITALELTATYLENLFSDPVTVTINIDFAPLGSGILGGTSVYYTATPPSWTTTRTGLVAGMDNNDYVETFLPDGSTLPVRYDGSSSTVTDEDRCLFSVANYGAAMGTIGGASGATTFSSQMSWDYDPSNGVSGSAYCFQSVALHEVGHVLGFVSRAESWYQPNTDIVALDIYRFQRTDGTADYNPDDVSEFAIRPRLVDYNNPGDDHNSNIFTNIGVDTEYRMSDGTPYQASHFRQGSVDGIMQPAMSNGSTFYPNYYRAADIAMFDATGWDYPPNSPPTTPSNPVPADLSVNVQRNVTLSWSGGDPDPGDIVTYDVYLGTSNPPQKVAASQSSLSYTPLTPLLIETQYYWRVQAWDNRDAFSISPLWTFVTAPLCGDADGSESVDISDAVYLINYIFGGGPAPDPLLAGDANCDGAVDISDAVYLIAYIFSGGPEPCAGCK